MSWVINKNEHISRISQLAIQANNRCLRVPKEHSQGYYYVIRKFEKPRDLKSLTGKWLETCLSNWIREVEIPKHGKVLLRIGEKVVRWTS